jgi:hypothetical protein
MDVRADHTELHTLCPENDLLLALARLDLDADQVERCRRLLREHKDRFDWGYFIDQAGRHKVLPLIGRHIAHYRLHHSDSGKPLIPYFEVYGAVYQGNRLRNETLGDEFRHVLSRLTDSDLRYAVRKGPVLTEGLYRDIGLRRMNDLDVLAQRENIGHIRALLRDYGYAQGRLTEKGTSIESFDRRTHATWQLYVSNDLPFRKPGNRIGVDVFAIDICLDIFQPSDHSGAATDHVLARRQASQLFGRPSFTLSLPDQLLDVCTHFYKEATSRYYIEAGADLQLLKFLDVALLCDQVTKSGEWPIVTERGAQYGVAEAVYYALQHTAWIYPTHVPAEQLAALRPDDTGFLEEYGALDGDPQQWSLSFAERLFHPDREHLIEGTSVIPHA